MTVRYNTPNGHFVVCLLKLISKIEICAVFAIFNGVRKFCAMLLVKGALTYLKGSKSMNYEIVGIQQKRGEYEGRPYDNTLLHVLSTNVNIIGKKVDTIKVKTAVFQGLLKDCGCASDGLIGKSADISFDRYGNLEYFDMLPPGGK